MMSDIILMGIVNKDEKISPVNMFSYGKYLCKQENFT